MNRRNLIFIAVGFLLVVASTVSSIFFALQSRQTAGELAGIKQAMANTPIYTPDGRLAITVPPPSPMPVPSASEESDDAAFKAVARDFLQVPHTEIGAGFVYGMLQDQLVNYFFERRSDRTPGGLAVFLPEMQVQRLVIPERLFDRFGEPDVDLGFNSRSKLLEKARTISFHFPSANKKQTTFDYRSVFSGEKGFTIAVDLSYDPLSHQDIPKNDPLYCDPAEYSADIQDAAAVLFKPVLNSYFFDENGASNSAPSIADPCQYIMVTSPMQYYGQATTSLVAYSIDLPRIFQDYPTTTKSILLRSSPAIIVKKKEVSPRPSSDVSYVFYSDGYLRILAGMTYPFRYDSGLESVTNEDIVFVTAIQKDILTNLSVLPTCEYGCAY